MPKPKPLDIKKIISKNPKVDEKKLRESRRAIRKLREQGILKEKTFDLAPPFSRPPAQSSESEKDPRGVTLRSKK